MKKTNSILTAACLLGGALVAAESQTTRPNILFLFADDWGQYASCYRDAARPGPNDVIVTPVFDSIATNGIRFNNAYCSAPSCSPSRAALATGVQFYSCGAYAILHGAPAEEEVERFRRLPQFPKIMSDAGYHVGLAYKTLNPESKAGVANYGTKGYPEGCCHFSQKVMAAEDHHAKAEAIFAAVKQDFERCVNKAQELHQPFLFMAGPHNTHRPWVKGFGKAFWGLNPDDLKGKMPAYLPDVPEVREDFADYLGECMVLDRYMKEYLDVLREKGLLDNTLVIATGDNGIPGFPRGKANCYDAGVHQALLVQWPEGIKKTGRVVDDFVSLIDLAPTFYELAGVKVPAECQGTSLVNIFNSEKSGQVDPARNYIVAGRERHSPNAREGNLPYPTRMVRDQRYLFLRNFAPDRWPASRGPNFGGGDFDGGPTADYYKKHANDPDFQRFLQQGLMKRPGVEFYDMEKDPDCLVNLAENPECKVLVEKYDRLLTEYLNKTGDRRVTGDGTTFDQPPFTLLQGLEK